MSPFAQQLAERMHRIRKHRKMYQYTVASLLNITQQGYSYLERNPGNLKHNTAQRFCEVMNISLSFLYALDIPVTEANLRILEKVTTLDMYEAYIESVARKQVQQATLLKKCL